MKLTITSDSYWESKMSMIPYELSRMDYETTFNQKKYGDIDSITIILTCQPDVIVTRNKIEMKKQRKEFIHHHLLRL